MWKNRPDRLRSSTDVLILNLIFGGDDRIRTGDRGFADRCLATWLRRLGLADFRTLGQVRSHERGRASAEVARQHRGGERQGARARNLIHAILGSISQPVGDGAGDAWRV